MTSEPPILVISRDTKLIELFKRGFESIASRPLEVVEGIDQGCLRTLEEDLGLILLHVDGRLDERGVAQLLWVASTTTRPVPVVVVDESYREDQALTCFRLGVRDYLGRTLHLDQLAGIVAALAVRGRKRVTEPSLVATRIRALESRFLRILWESSQDPERIPRPSGRVLLSTRRLFESLFGGTRATTSLARAAVRKKREERRDPNNRSRR